MKKFLIQITLLSVLLLAGIGFVFLQVDGYDDAYYLRFTSKQQESLVLGTSRAAQGLNPAVLNRELNRNDLYNYAFTIEDSPYGPVYLKSIQRKVKKGGKDGIFLLCVDPWSLSCRTGFPEDSTRFREVGSFIDQTKWVNYRPNGHYLLQSYPKSYYELLVDPGKEICLHDNGWLEISIDMEPDLVARRTVGKASDYRRYNLPKYRYSATRWAYLEKTIQWLKPHGQVFLIRLPVDSLLLAIDDELLPGFGDSVQAVADRNHLPFIDFSQEGDYYTYTDGNHLYSESANELSKNLAMRLKAFIENDETN